MKKRTLRTRISLLAVIGFIFFLAISSKRPVETPVPLPTPTQPVMVMTVPVLYVIDGDSIAVSINGDKQEVRLIGIDAPERYDQHNAPACFADQATEKLKTMLTGQTVTLTPDPTQDDQDVYGRLLRYMTLPDGTAVNKTMISEGYAREYTFITPYQLQNEFRIAQTEAQANKRGLWGYCNGK